ncbi:MAG: Transcriptional regulator/sugar kinase [Pelotomaculum thermopropionicum]|uniref:Transcriptional regulator/sugar kinase n=1 Tax=Pelotomaculum thermopropionicum TaxID=110500 RepID=A0A101HSB5_9FIRM|nr:MAG: Transcriptional regulator/sugar kinase [Pelotomaculum thermopropionicum]
MLSGQYVIGVDLGGTKIYTALAGDDGRILAELKIPTGAEKGLQDVVDGIVDSVERVQKTAAAVTGAVSTLVLGAPGPLDTKGGIIHYAPNLRWRNVPIRQIVEERTGIPVLLDNDANLAALGEHVFGAGRGVANMVYITVSTGVGGGLILGGKLYRGFTDGAGEIGHMTILPYGPLCSCGNRGCLEAVASGTAIAREARDLVVRGAGQVILAAAEGNPEKIDAAVVASAATGGDPEAVSIITGAAGSLGIGIANMLNLLNPSLVILGGGVMETGELFWEEVKKEVRNRALEAAWAVARLVPAELGGRAGVMGAIALALGKE